MAEQVVRPFMTKQAFDEVSAALWGQHPLDYHTNYITPRANWKDSDIREEAIYFYGLARGMRLAAAQNSSKATTTAQSSSQPKLNDDISDPLVTNWPKHPVMEGRNQPQATQPAPNHPRHNTSVSSGGSSFTDPVGSGGHAIRGSFGISLNNHAKKPDDLGPRRGARFFGAAARANMSGNTQSGWPGEKKVGGDTLPAAYINAYSMANMQDGETELGTSIPSLSLGDDYTRYRLMEQHRNKANGNGSVPEPKPQNEPTPSVKGYRFAKPSPATYPVNNTKPHVNPSQANRYNGPQTGWPYGAMPTPRVNLPAHPNERKSSPKKPEEPPAYQPAAAPGKEESTTTPPAESQTDWRYSRDYTKVFTPSTEDGYSEKDGDEKSMGGWVEEQGATEWW